jgi:hypothetical protein
MLSRSIARYLHPARCVTSTGVMVSRNSFPCQRQVHGEPGSLWTRTEPEPYTHGVLIAGTHIFVTIEGGGGNHGRGDRYGQSDRVLLHVLR